MKNPVIKNKFLLLFCIFVFSLSSYGSNYANLDFFGDNGNKNLIGDNDNDDGDADDDDDDGNTDKDDYGCKEKDFSKGKINICEVKSNGKIKLKCAKPKKVEKILAKGGYLQKTFYLDSDSDVLGDADTSVIACEAPEGYVSNDIDTDDSKPATQDSIIAWVSKTETTAESSDINFYIDFCQQDFNDNAEAGCNLDSTQPTCSLLATSGGIENIAVEAWISTSASSPKIRLLQPGTPFANALSSPDWKLFRNQPLGPSQWLLLEFGASLSLGDNFPFENGFLLTRGVDASPQFYYEIFTGTDETGGATFNPAGSDFVTIGYNRFASNQGWTVADVVDPFYSPRPSSEAKKIYCLATQK